MYVQCPPNFLIQIRGQISLWTDKSLMFAMPSLKTMLWSNSKPIYDDFDVRDNSSDWAPLQTELAICQTGKPCLYVHIVQEFK